MERSVNKIKKGSIFIPIASFGIIAAFAAILIIPASREIFKRLSTDHPYLMGFIKFGLLATVGEVFASRIRTGGWTLPIYTHWRALIWGAIGISITFMMKAYTYGVVGLMQNKLLPGGESNFLRAFYTAAVMNLTFGPTFMAFHKCTDKYLDLRHAGEKKPGLKGVVGNIDWHGFVSFTLFKTIPLFWIPAHTVTFMLPAEYQVIAAAALSIALGVFLSLKK